MRELCVISILIGLGFVAESSARYVLMETNRLYVEIMHQESGTTPPAKKQTSQNREELTALSYPGGYTIHRH